MRRLIYLSIIPIFLLCTGIAQADREQAAFAIQKAKAFVAKVKAKSEEMKAPAEDLKKAQDFIGQAEATLKANTSILGTLKREAEPGVLYHAEMAEISASIVLSHLEKISQEKEYERLEKMVPDVEAKIKIFNDKNAEIQRLTEALKKPDGALTATKKDLADKAKAVEDLTAENRRLKEELKALETQKGSDIVEMRAKLQSANRHVEFQQALNKLDYLARWSDKGTTLIIPRKDLLKMTAKGPMLAPGGEALANKFAELWKAFPEAKMKIDVHGFGNPAKYEDKKATEAMAELLLKTFVTKGIRESAVAASGKGSASPLFSKGAVEENRRAEITVSP
jgi:cell division protein FtsB